VAYTVNTLAQYQREPKKCDWDALLRLLRYLRGTYDFGLFYPSTEDPAEVAMHLDGEAFNLDTNGSAPICFADASYGEDDGRRSRSGYVFAIAGGSVAWLSKKQSVVALSSTEAEFYSLAEAVKEAIWQRRFFEELNFLQANSAMIMQDNQSTMTIAMNPVHHHRVKHMDIRSHFIRDHIEKRHIQLKYCPTTEMVADILTKALPTSQHNKLMVGLGLQRKRHL
jgi:hypothetical protein